MAAGTQNSPPQSPVKLPREPFPSENEMAEEKRSAGERHRKDADGLPDQPPDAPVKDSKPYKNLK